MGNKLDFSSITWDPDKRTLSGGFIDELIDALELARRELGDEFTPPTDWGIHLHWEYQDGDIDVNISRETGGIISRFHFSDFFIPQEADFGCDILTDRLKWFCSKKNTSDIKSEQQISEAPANANPDHP